MTLLRTLLSSLCLLSLAACPDNSRHLEANATPGAVPSNLVLRSYEVPNGGAQQLRGSLKDLFWFGGDAKDASKFVGRVDVSPDGRLLVLAPESVQAGVKTLVDNLKASPVKAPGTVRIDYWVVTGTAGQSGALPAALNEVAAALKEVEHNDGPMNFTLVEKLSVSTLSNERGSVEGRDTRIDQFASVVDGDVVADLDIARLAVGQKLRTRVRIKPGVIAALGSAGMATHDSNATPATIYFIVRAAQVDGATP